MRRHGQGFTSKAAVPLNKGETLIELERDQRGAMVTDCVIRNCADFDHPYHGEIVRVQGQEYGFTREG